MDTLFVNYTIPQAGDDEINIPFATSGFTDILANDNLSNPDASTISIELQPENGTVELGTGVAKHILTYTPDINFVGLDSAIYMVCQEGCTCATATVYFNVGKDAKCEVPSIITPNNDRMNDAFIIPCLAEDGTYPNNVLSIFNQWGDEVYHAEPYKNNWEGTFDGEDLPASTYFYIIDLGNGEKPMSGYLIIQR